MISRGFVLEKFDKKEERGREGNFFPSELLASRTHFGLKALLLHIETRRHARQKDKKRRKRETSQEGDASERVAKGSSRGAERAEEKSAASVIDVTVGMDAVGGSAGK
jgi:hypothetical protein